MPVPKRKRSRARRDSRFANKGMVMHSITACNNCEAPLLPHAACHICGFYKGVKVLNTKIDRKINRIQTRQALAAAKNKKQATAVPAESAQ
jgi:large subunit ribosomal protein L32